MTLLSPLREVNHPVLLLVFSDDWLHLPSVTGGREVLRTFKASWCKGTLTQSRADAGGRAEAV